jgi:tRNA/tmRNA/rRNA uracil-C5-methylase (TrmA/RlmC/RlmD family)
MADGDTVEFESCTVGSDGTVELDVGPVAHGGACVARLAGRVVFVRHALPGERVRAVVTDAGHDRYWRADAVEVLRASDDRVPPPCPHSGPGGCGGCDWQHAALPAQRRFKASVVAEQLRRLGGVDLDALGTPVVVEELPGTPDGLGWRTRVRFAVAADGTVGLRRARSHDVMAVPGCPIAHPLVLATGVDRLAGPADAAGLAGIGSVEVVASVPAGRAVVLRHPLDGPGGDAPGELVEQVSGGRRFTLEPGVFWQVHPAALDTLVDAVGGFLRPAPGETAVDLYGGAGPFAAMLADAVGPTGRVVLVESDPAATRSAARSIGDLAQVSVRGVRASPAVITSLLPAGQGPDIVVLDPPRAGAGAAVMRALLAGRPRAVAYVACDPASLARDVAVARSAGYTLAGLRAFDLFPMTAHVECVALLTPERR